MQLIILGMHRSGTSALARVLGLLGCYAGEEGDFPPADEANPRGYWERRDVWAADEELLAALGGSWDAVAELDPARLSAGDRERFESRVRAVVAKLDGQRPWVIKDPRLCLTFPYWRPFLERPICLLIHRSPLAVAQSIAARDPIPLPVGAALWERYNLAALAASAGLPRLLVSHRELLADPVGTARRLLAELEALGVGGLALPSPEALHGFIDPALDRHGHDAEAECRLCPAEILDLARAFDERRAFELDPVPEPSAWALDLLRLYQPSGRHIRHLEQRMLALYRQIELDGEIVGREQAALRLERSERQRNEAEVARLAARVEELETAFAPENEARLRAEAAAKTAAAHLRQLEEKIAEATRAYEAEHEARLRAEATAGELHRQAVALQEKIAADSQVFAAEHDARLRAESGLAELHARLAPRG